MKTTMNNNLSLREFKDLAMAKGFSKIARVSRGATTVSLDSWNGAYTEAGSSFEHVSVGYTLSGDRVTAHKTGEPGTSYKVS
jgi:hypothetical protein